MILRIAACNILVSSFFLQTIQAFALLQNTNLHVVQHSAGSSSCQRRLQLLDNTRLHAGAAGGGMGMAAATATAAVKKNKVKNDKKKNGMCKKINSSGNGNGKKQVTFDVNASLLRLEKRYEQLELAAAKQLARRQDDDDDENDNDEDPRWANSDDNDEKEEEENNNMIITSEFIVAARASTRLGVDDWVPIAQLLLSRLDDDTLKSSSMSSLDLASIAVSAYCRELSHLAALGAPAFFKSVARNGLEYSLESIDSFHKHVYTGVVDGGHARVMTKAEARKVLGLEDNTLNSNGSDDNVVMNPKSAIKQAYRRLSFDLHPDRFQGTPEEEEAASQRFALVKQAYESLSSGVRGVQGSSWYESLGGKSRTDFIGPVNLMSLTAALNDLQKQHGCEVAIAGLDKDLIQSFVARNLRSEIA